MELVTKSDLNDILLKLAVLQGEVDRLKTKRNPILDSLAEVWDNPEDERWNDC